MQSWGHTRLGSRPMRSTAHGTTPCSGWLGPPRQSQVWRAQQGSPFHEPQAHGIMKHTTWLRLGLVDGPGSPFHELQLNDSERNAKGAIRSHNYSKLYRPEYQVPAQPGQAWGQLFRDPTLPLVVDVGCGAGRFLLLLAHRERERPESNYLGLDIHAALMERANLWAAQRSLQSHLCYLVANAAISLPSLLASYPGPVQLVCVQYPDPHVRKERHVVHAEFVQDVTSLLKPGAHVLLQSDIEETAAHMRDTFERHASAAFALHPLHAQHAQTQPSCSSSPSLDWSPSTPEAPGCQSHVGSQGKVSYSGGVRVRNPESASAVAAAAAARRAREAGGDDGWRSRWAEGGWLAVNPVGAPTEREVFMDQVTGDPVYRVYLVRV